MSGTKSKVEQAAARLSPNAGVFMKPRFSAARVEVYQDKSGSWRWRLHARNNRIIADSAEGYVERRGAVRAAKGFRRTAVAVRLVVEGQEVAW